MWLQSAHPMLPPAIDPNCLCEDADVDTMVARFRTTKRLLDAPALKALQTTARVETDAVSEKFCASGSIPSIIRSALVRWASTIRSRWSTRH